MLNRGRMNMVLSHPWYMKKQNNGIVLNNDKLMINTWILIMKLALPSSWGGSRGGQEVT